MMGKAIKTSLLLLMVVAGFTIPASPQHRSPTKFVFGSGKPPSGYAHVQQTTLYSDALGYGFEPGASLSASCLDCATSDQPFFFSVRLPEGNYNVTVTFGNPNRDSTTTVKAELRRLLLEQVHAAAGKPVTRTFTVNLRTPRIDGSSGIREVKLKPRERATEMLDWDEKLTIEFNGDHPSITRIEVTPARNAPTVFILGDSTVCDQALEPYASWGQMLPRFFKPGIAIANHAESGESLRSSLAAGRLDKVLSVMRPGDYLFIQYGHNDQKEKGEGVGAFTTYKADLKYFVASARKRGGLPVLVTSVNRRNFDGEGKVYSTLGDYPEAVRQVAREENVPLIDLNLMSKALYEALGPEKSGLLFKPGDGTHHNNYGSYELAKCIVEGIRAAHLRIVQYLTDDATAFDPHRPDPPEQFKLPVSPQSAAPPPLGN
jgi:lysophospholipase L1-like esterase